MDRVGFAAPRLGRAPRDPFPLPAGSHVVCEIQLRADSTLPSAAYPDHADPPSVGVWYNCVRSRSLGGIRTVMTSVCTELGSPPVRPQGLLAIVSLTRRNPASSHCPASRLRSPHGVLTMGRLGASAERLRKLSRVRSWSLRHPRAASADSRPRLRD